MRLLVSLAALTLIAWSTSAQPVPAELSRLVARARLDSPVADWCRTEFRAGHTDAYAVALTSGTGGRYVVLDLSGTVVELAAFSGSPDLACYTPTEIRKLDRAIRESDTVHGHIATVSATTVVCGFVDDTTAICWQYSPGDRVFVKVGQWVT